MDSELYIGLMSGTSMDAVDCALVDLSSTNPKLIDFLNLPIPTALKASLSGLCEDGTNQVHTLGVTDIDVAILFSQAVIKILDRNALSPKQIIAIGSHGQTIRHSPVQNRTQPSQQPFTIQIGDPNTICERTGITTVADFRRHDIAAGGQGAPLVPAFHQALLPNTQSNHVILNIGGMANVTVIKKDQGLIAGFDTGPGNVLMDLWVSLHHHKPYDDNGNWANTGTCNQELLQQFLSEPFFQALPPKSTGRELFNKQWLEANCKQISQSMPAEDIQATLLELTSISISQSIKNYFASGDISICGGGAHNSSLIKSLRRNMESFNIFVSSDSELNVDADSVEAMAFAWLAQQAINKKHINLSMITGASRPLIMGGIYQVS